ncbi:unnamed protein product [Rhizoctonia solani]|uniref:Transmembrane protein n=1 Tax=Rhizoctonia solani TaxID=456999 RepID=A0A8H3AWY0_9AGAM|nr:unnamed protein product [Rhizoctonia solani]
MSTTSLPPWDRTPFTFGWNGNETGPYTLPQCSNTTWNYWEKGNNRDPNPPPSPPYQLVIYAGGYVPYMVLLNNTVATGNTTWIANLPVGPRYGISMKDSKNYTAGASRNLISTLNQTYSGHVEVTGSGQCQQAFINVKNGTAPYRMEVVPMNTQQKTLHYASSPFGVTLDMGAGVEYFLAVYDSAGNSAVMGSYNILASPDNSCLGEAATVTAGQYSTLYPGGTSSATAASASSNGLATSTVIGIAVTVPVAAIILTALLLWFCYKQNRRQRELEEKPEIDTRELQHSGPNPLSNSIYVERQQHDLY